MSQSPYAFERLFRAPFSVPNGLAAAPDGLWIADQVTDRVALVQESEPNEYGVTQQLKEIVTESSNTSGLCCTSDSLWLAANGNAVLWRPARATDAQAGAGEVLRIDLRTGATAARHPVPGGGGTHGIEADTNPEYIWISTLKQQTLSKVRIADWIVTHTLPLAHDRSHGLVRTESALWIVYTNERQIVETDAETGARLRTIQVPDDMPEPHGLTRQGPHLLYCDATTGWIVRVTNALSIG